MLRQIVPSTDEIYQWDFPKVIVLKSSFKKQLFANSSLSAESHKQAMLKDFVQSVDKSYQWSFSELVVLKRCTKITINSFFRRVTCT